MTREGVLRSQMRSRDMHFDQVYCGILRDECTRLNTLESVRNSLERCAAGVDSLLRPVRGSLLAQFHITRRSMEDMRPIRVMSVHTLIFIDVFVYVGREDLAAGTATTNQDSTPEGEVAIALRACVRAIAF